MATITTKDTFGRMKTYEVVEKIPAGFFVWNIGENMGSDEYIPLAEWMHPEDKDNYSINAATVKAIKLDRDEVLKLRKAAHYVGSLKEAEKALKSTRKGPASDRKRKAAQETIEIFKRITA